LLGLNTWVDLRKGVDDQVALEVLVSAVRGEAPDAVVRERTQAMLANVCPYRSLHAFREEDAPFFFGRERYTTQLVQRVGAKSVIAVVGASGSGKSSVVRAGLVPSLRQDTGTVWDFVTMRPGDRPLHALAAAMVPLLAPEMTATDQLAEIGKLAGYFREGTVGLRDVVERVLKRQPGTDRVLLIADQWEELYTVSTHEKDVRQFIDTVLDATATVPISLVLAVRGDFYGRVLSYRSLVDRLGDCILNLPPMNRDELQEVITKPADKLGLIFQSGLTNRLLADVGEEPGNLPLLEFVLTSLWEHRHRGELSHETYDAIGGMHGAITKRADESYNKLSDVQQSMVRRILLQLVRPGAGSEDTRRRVALKEIGEEAKPTVDEFAKERLLVTGRDDSTGEETLEIAHETLIKHWWRLRGWLDEDRDFLTWRQRLQSALADWQRYDRRPATLLRGEPLDEAERWYSQRQQDLGGEERAFIGASIGSRNRKRIFRWIVVIFAVIAAVAFAYWLWAARQPQIPEMETIPADKFLMGAGESDSGGQENERPTHEVVIKRPFKIGKYEVTFEEYDRFVRAEGGSTANDEGWGRGDRPVINVTWVKAVEYADWLSGKTGQRYRLPTEAEWEYAARGGTLTSRHWGDDPGKACSYGNVFDKTGAAAIDRNNSGIKWDPHLCDDGYDKTAPVGQFEANGYKLYDMAGNVSEWVQDCWHNGYDDAPVDGSAWEEKDCQMRVIRGGSWKSRPENERSASRGRVDPTDRGNMIGFRLAQDIP
jgi:formylglycine-generating enzyme required for sulfatase activity